MNTIHKSQSAYSRPFKRALVVGLGRSGFASANLLLDLGVEVYVNDEKQNQQLHERAQQLRLRGAHVQLANQDFVEDADIVIVSPGVHLDLPMLEQARRRDVPIVSELDLGAHYYQRKLVAVTGTNGKSSVVTALARMYTESGCNTMLGGNIGTAFCSLVKRAVAQEVEVFVAEVSSYQLETVHAFHPNIALVLNIAPDHIDYHRSYEAYTRAKARITLNQTEQDWLIIPTSLQDWRTTIESPVKTCYFGTEEGPVPGIYFNNQHLIWKAPDQTECAWPVPSGEQLSGYRLMNALAVAATGLVDGLTPAEALEEFRLPTRLEHRTEVVAAHNGVTWINDSKATNVAATIAAFSTITTPVVLIAGGIDKQEDFTRLIPVLKSQARACVLIGTLRDKLFELWSSVVACHRVDSLAEAVELATRVADPGDTVLLSPACASFDMFQDFEDRGHQFKSLVHRAVEAQK